MKRIPKSTRKIFCKECLDLMNLMKDKDGEQKEDEIKLNKIKEKLSELILNKENLGKSELKDKWNELSKEHLEFIKGTKEELKEK